MELKDYTTEQLRGELKRRVELAKAQKAAAVADKFKNFDGKE